MENFGLTRENHYKSKISWNKKEIDVDLRIKDYDNDEDLDSCYILMDILLKKGERLLEKIKEKVNKKIEIDNLEKLNIKILILKNNKFKIFYENENKLISIYGKVYEFSLKKGKEDKYLKKKEKSLEVEILEKDKDFIEDEVLGLLIKDEDKTNYVGNIELPDGKKVDLCLEYSEDEELKKNFEKIIQSGRKVLKNIDSLYKKIYDGYVGYTLELARNWWSDNGFDEEGLSYLDKFLDKESAEKMKNGELTEKAYRKILFLTEISIGYSEIFSITETKTSVDYEETLSVTAYDGEWIFGGHWILLSGNIEGEFTDGDIYG